MSTADPLAALGHGGADDRLSWRVVVQIAWRALPYVRPVAHHIVRFAVVAVPFTLVFLVFFLFGLDLFFNRTIIGEPLTPFAARMLSLDPAIYVDVEQLSVAARKTLLREISIVTVGSFIFTIPGAIAFLYFRIWILQQINQKLRVEMLERVQTLSLRFHANHESGDSIYRIYQDSAMVTGLIQALFLEPIPKIFVSIVGFLFVLSFDPWLAVILMLTSVALLWLGYQFSSPLRVGFRRAREANSQLTARIRMALAGIRVVKAYGFEQAVQGQFDADSKRALEMAYQARTRWVLYGVLAFAIAGVGLVFAEALMVMKAHSSSPTYASKAFVAIGFAIWNFGAFTAARERIGSAARGMEDLANIWARTQEMAVGLDRAFQFLDMPPDVVESADAVPAPSLREAVVYRDVHFSYEDARPVLAGVDLTMRPGTITAIVGPTGAGKSTLVSLLLRLFDPDRGHVEIDGVDLRDCQIASLRSEVAIALQENILFATSIRENIRYAVADASDAEVDEAARIACVDEFSAALSHGLDSVLGERGSKLSTGQRQRIGIARAIIKDAPILILDEPTAALDAVLEREVLDRLGVWGRGRAILLITHRLSTIRRADQIVFLAEGRVVESGSHDELVAREGSRYRAFVEVESSARVMTAATRAERT
jgi:ABC-type multidrug transport system fused ATPase/permease subunit